MAMRSRLFVVGCVVVGSGLGVGATLAGCSGDDTTVQPDASPDVTTDVINVPDVGPDVLKDGGADVVADNYVYDPKEIKDFMDAQVTNICTRFAQCCFGNDASAFDTAKCKDTVKDGTDFNLRPLNEAPSIIADGRIKLDKTASANCLAEVLTFSCPTTSAKDFSKASIDCFTAIQGTQANGQPCNYNIECVNGLCVPNADGGTDAGTGTCTGVKAIGQGPCGFRNEECQVRGFLGAPARCDVRAAADGGPAPMICATRLADGKDCDYNWECTSGTCDSVTFKCQQTAVSTDPGTCAFFTK